MAALSTSQVNKAGRTIRRFWRGDDADLEKFYASLDTLVAYRAGHQAPMTAANMGLRSITKTVGCQHPRVSQRLKRVPTIVDKLRREPTLPLASMQDLGGCRAILASIDEVRRVQERLERNKRVRSVSDYIGRPRESGYRGVHVIVEYHGHKIELQLRTVAMHQWAVFVESLSGAIDHDVKSGEGPQEVQDLMRVISQAMALEEAAQVVDDEVLSHMAQLRIAAAPYLTGERR